MKTRLDAELVRRGLARSREQAGDLIEKRAVLVSGIPATKPATQVDAETSITLVGERDDFVSRLQRRPGRCGGKQRIFCSGHGQWPPAADSAVSRNGGAIGNAGFPQ